MHDKKILIAEDEKPLAQALEFKFTRAGFITRNAVNGKEALALMQREKFDLLLLDLIMPKMDGFTVLAEMKKISINVPVIIISNLSQERDKEKARALGACDFFVKSNIPIADVVKYVKSILRK